MIFILIHQKYLDYSKEGLFMKICILTMQKVNNYGSLLQSYSLKKILERMGHRVYFLDIECNDDENKYMDGYRQYFVNENDYSNKFLAKLKKVDKYLLNQVRHYCEE